MKQKYGYNFTKRNSGGLGAIIHDLMNACKYTEQNNLELVFVKEGYDIPRLNGSIDDDLAIETKYWHSYFTSFTIVDEIDCVGMWPVYLPNSVIESWNIEEYSNLLKNKICVFQPEIYNEILQLVNQTAFNETTDIVLHIRRTEEKKIECNNFMPISEYVRECEYVLQELNNETNRIYICTDNQEICLEIKHYFAQKNVEVVWDDTEPDIPLQELRWKSKLQKTIAQKETMTAFKNIFIMKNAKYLIGGRMSYFFRIAELLGYPNKCLNIQDSDLFGIAPYSSVKYSVRPYNKKAYTNFINENINANIEKYHELYSKTNIINIPNFISPILLQQMKTEIENYKWWSYATIPNDNKWEIKYQNEIKDENIKECMYNLEQKHFAYRFRRTTGNHYDTCNCISCKLHATVSSFYVTDVLSKIVGSRYLIPREIFLSNYGKDDFLSLHHDINKGDIAVTFSLTYDWHPVYGGILHFCDKDKNIYNSVVPTLGSVNIFKLDPENGIDHFVSCINVNKNRYTLTAWYDVIN